MDGGAEGGLVHRVSHIVLVDLREDGILRVPGVVVLVTVGAGRVLIHDIFQIVRPNAVEDELDGILEEDGGLCGSDALDDGGNVLNGRRGRSGLNVAEFTEQSRGRDSHVIDLLMEDVEGAGQHMVDVEEVSERVQQPGIGCDCYAKEAGGQKVARAHNAGFPPTSLGAQTGGSKGKGEKKR